MKSLHRSLADRIRPAVAIRLLCALAAAILFVGPPGANARAFDDGRYIEDASRSSQAGLAQTDVAPWLPEAIQALDSYVPDPAFNGGRIQHDHFALINDRNPIGLVTEPLSNGDMLVAGLVPVGSNTTCSDGTRTCSIGLVRYDAAGNRQVWSNPGSYGHYFNQYVRYPNSTGLHEFVFLRDVKVRPGFIDVLVDEFDDNHPEPTLGRMNVRVITFREDGAYYGQFIVFGGSGGVDAEDFYGGQIVYAANSKMMVAGTGYDPFGPYVAVTRLAILGNGAPSLDTGWGDPYGTLTRIKRYYGPGGYCGSTHDDCYVTAYHAAAPAGVATVTDFYVGASIRIGGNNWDAIVLKISSQTGALKTEFNGTGWSRAVFDDPGSSLRDIAAGIYAYQNEVYIGAQVARRCENGIGLSKLNGANGNYNTAFGAGTGRVVFGGSSAQFCAPSRDYPLAISATGGRIGVVGYNSRESQSGENQRDPMLAVVNAGDGSVMSFASYPILEANGVRAGDGQFVGVYGGPNATSPFAASGFARAASENYTLSFVSGRFMPVSSDRIFGHGFD